MTEFSYSTPKNDIPRCYACEQERIVFPEGDACYCMKCLAIAKRESVACIVLKEGQERPVEILHGKLREILGELRQKWSDVFVAQRGIDHVQIRVEGGA